MRDIDFTEHEEMFNKITSAIQGARAEIAALRQALWDVYEELGFDTNGDATPIGVPDLAKLVVNAAKEHAKEAREQCRLLGISGNTEAKLLAEIDRLKAPLTHVQAQYVANIRGHAGTPCDFYIDIAAAIKAAKEKLP